MIGPCNNCSRLTTTFIISGVIPNIFLGGDRDEGGGVPRIFLILDLKMAICGAFLVQFLAVHLKL